MYSAILTMPSKIINLSQQRLGNQGKCYTRAMCGHCIFCRRETGLLETLSFLARLADLGSNNPERFGCCHGKEQARGVVASFLGRNLGRVLLRGVVRVRHVALKASVGLGDGVQAARTSHGRRSPGNEFDAGIRPFVQPHVGSPF
jgi:hypothetical protein